MPTASGAKGYIVLSAPTDSVNDILDVLTEDDYEGERRELSSPEDTSALIVGTIGENQATREFTPAGSGLILRFFGKSSAGAGIETGYLQGVRQRCQTAGSSYGCQGLEGLSSRDWGSQGFGQFIRSSRVHLHLLLPSDLCYGLGIACHYEL